MRVNGDFVTRFVPQRAARIEADDRELTGYAIVFDSLSQDLGGFKERIAPTAVDRTLREGSNVDALQDHERKTSTILGSTDSGLLRLTKDRTGLRVKIAPPDTSNVRDLMMVVKSGLVKGMSFAFRVMPDGQQWDEEEQGGLVRTVTDMVFSEVSIVVNPAYLNTSVAARNAVIDRHAFEDFKATRGGHKVSLLLQYRRVLCDAGLPASERQRIRREIATLERQRISPAMRVRMIRAEARPWHPSAKMRERMIRAGAGK